MTTDSLETALRGPATDPTADLAAALARAESEDLVDVAYAVTDSPVGPLLVAATPAGLVRLGFQTEDHSDILDDLAQRVSPRVLEAPSRLDETRR
jgi:methylated-DNA-[protein]-cysteine S-methyltransferase